MNEIIDALLGGKRNVTDAYRDLEDVDEQSAELFKDTYDALAKILRLSEAETEALRRLKWVVDNAQTKNAGLLRNNVFKGANAIGLRLPSGSF